MLEFRKSDVNETTGQNPGTMAIPGDERRCRFQPDLSLCQLTDSNHDKPIAPNLLEREFTVDTANTVYVSDINYIPTREGWLFLTIVIDLFSRARTASSIHSFFIISSPHFNPPPTGRKRVYGA